MNLSSRYREAINTITILKKELSIHQKTSSDLIALHKQYVEKYGVPIPDINLGSLSSTLDAPENDNLSPSSRSMTELSQKVSVTEVRGKDSNTPAFTSKENSTSNGFASIKPSINGIHPLQQSQRLKSRSYDDNHGGTTKDHVAITTTTTNINTTSFSKELDKSWPNGKGTALKEKKSEQLENAFGDLYSNQFFPPNYKSSLTTTPERDVPHDSDLKFDEYLFKTKSGSNVDAFEASFNTSFPSSFSANSMTSSTMDLAFDVPGFSDPFFLGPSSPGSNNSNKNVSGRISSQPNASANIPSAKLSLPYTESVAAKRKSFEKTNATLSTSSEMALDKRSNELFPSSALNMFESLSMNENSSKSQRDRKSVV